MSVVVEEGRIRLVGRCPAEDAESLLAALESGGAIAVDLSEAQKLHLAVVQILLAARPAIAGDSESPFIARHLTQLLQ